MLSDTRRRARCGRPRAQRARAAEMARFMSWAGERAGARSPTTTSCGVVGGELEEFWAAIWEFCGVRASTPVRAGARLARDAGRELV